MKLSDLTALFKTAPKTLDQAKSAGSQAVTALDSVSSLFAAASLDLDTMLAAGPDSLKAHIAGLSAKDTELAAAIAKATEMESKLATITTDLAQAKAASEQLSATHASLCASVSFTPDAKAADGQPLDFATAFKAHVAKEAALVLAKDGRPPVTHVSTAAVKIDPKLTGVARTEAALKAEASNAAIVRA